MSNPDNRETVPWEQFIDIAKREGVAVRLEGGQYHLSKQVGNKHRQWVGDFVNPCLRRFVFEQAGRFGINPALFFRSNPEATPAEAKTERKLEDPA